MSKLEAIGLVILIILMIVCLIPNAHAEDIDIQAIISIILNIKGCNKTSI